MDSALRKEIKQILITKIETKLNQSDLSKKSGNPFVDILFGDLSNLKSFIHGMATTLGSSYEKIATTIAKSNSEFIEAKKLDFSGKISDQEKTVIKDIVKDLEEAGGGSNYNGEVKAIYNAKDSSLRKTRITIDLYLKNKSGKEFFIEMKGPDPNKKEVRAAKEDLLNVIAMKKRSTPFSELNKKVAVIFGVYYNNQDGEYDNWKVSPMFEKQKGILLQEEFWDFLGGKGTYGELLEIIKEVRDEIYPKIKKKLKPITDKL
ncbi:MAG: TdeIII family type II restriction endonuclease [Candidatus Micrarchaeota archaeon]